MSPPQQQQRKAAGRPRSASSQQAILAATLTLVAEEGIQGTHIEAIATRAGVGKTTIYRRWPSKEAVILDALSELHGQIKLIDTGNLRTDLLTFLHELLHLMETHPLHERLIFRLLGELKVHPEFAQVLYERVYAPRLGFMTQFVERAEARGELRQKLDPLFIGSLLVGPLLYYKIVTQVLPASQPLNTVLEQIVDVVLAALGPPT